VGRKVRIEFAHPAHLIADTLNAMDEFTEQFEHESCGGG
jgi:hypothetical protein